MTYDEFYKDAKVQDQPEGEDVFKNKEQGKCFQCEKLTHWISLSFETFICSPECEASLWDEYSYALFRTQVPTD